MRKQVKTKGTLFKKFNFSSPAPFKKAEYFEQRPPAYTILQAEISNFSRKMGTMGGGCNVPL